MNEVDEVKTFIDRLSFHAHRKAKLYDGSDRDIPVDVSLRYLIEELGEVSSEISRNRFNSAEDECLDVAHCAFLLWKAIRKYKTENEHI